MVSFSVRNKNKIIVTFRPVRASAKIRRILLAMLKSFGVAVGVGLGFYVAYKLVRRSIRAVQPTKKEEKKEKKKDEKTNEEKTQPGRCDGCSRENRDESLMRCGGCRRAWFCNRSCQTSYWPSHRAGCQAIQQFQQRIQPSFKKGKYRETLDEIDKAMRLVAAAPTAEKAVNMPMASQRAVLWAKGALLRMRGDTYLRLNNLAVCQRSYVLALKVAQEAGDFAMQANVLSGMGSAARRAREPLDQIRALLDSAMVAAENAMHDDEDEARRAKASILSNLGVLNTMRAESQQHGIRQLEEALEIRKNLGDPYQICTTQVNVAGTYMCSGSELKAVELYEDAAAVARENNYTQVHVAVLINLSNQYEAGNAIRDHRKAAETRKKLADALSDMNVGRELPESCAICLSNLNVFQPSPDENSRIVIPECMHAMHKVCFEQCQQARCPTCMSGVDMCPTTGPAAGDGAESHVRESHGREQPTTTYGNAEHSIAAAAAAAATAAAATVAPSDGGVVLESHATFELE